VVQTDATPCIKFSHRSDVSSVLLLNFGTNHVHCEVPKPPKRWSINNKLNDELHRYLHAYCVMWNQHLQRRTQAISVSTPRNDKLRVAITLDRAHTATNAKATAFRFICRDSSPTCKDTYRCFGERRCVLSEMSVLIHRIAPRHVSVDTW